MSSDEHSSSLPPVECDGCGAVLGEQLLDDFTVHATGGPERHVTCPACGAEIRISYS